MNHHNNDDSNEKYLLCFIGFVCIETSGEWFGWLLNLIINKIIVFNFKLINKIIVIMVYCNKQNERFSKNKKKKLYRIFIMK